MACDCLNCAEPRCCVGCGIALIPNFMEADWVHTVYSDCEFRGRDGLYGVDSWVGEREVNHGK